MTTLSAIKNAAHYVRITVFDINNQTITPSIEGMVTGGSININGTSAIRRSGSLTMLVPEGTTYYRVTDIDNLISANKKIKVEIGIKDLDSDTDPIYYNMGTFAIGAASVTHNLQGVNISITLKDLMCLLNGELGGLFMSTVIHSPLYDVVTGAYEYPKIKDLIYALVCDYGDFPRDRVEIKDIPDRIRNTVRWTGSYEIYSYDVNPNDPYSGKIFAPIIPDNINNYEAYSFNDNIGYVNTDFTYPTDKELVSNAGESIVSMLDKIKGILGNFEYFFDKDGVFHFQEIQNYVNKGSAEDSWTGAFDDAYLTSPDPDATQYELDSAIGISYSNNPQYSGIKNDIMAWGQFNDSKLELGYHLIIDKTPTVKEWNQPYTVYYRTDEAGILRAYPNGDGEATLLAIEALNAMDWRQQIYLDYILRKNENGYTRTPYSLEIANSWPLIYDVQNLRFYADIEDSSEQKKKLNSMPYFIDVLDPTTLSNEEAKRALDKLTITRAGRRPWSKKDNDVNCLFSPDFPDCVYVQAGQGEQTKTDRNEALAQILNGDGIEFMQLAPELYKGVSIGAAYNSAFDWIRSIIHEMTTYNESINVTCMPFYGVEPNTRIRITDKESNINGDYVIKSMSIPLAHNGTMTIQASKAIERI